jgi:hypothetical protein
MTLQIGEARPVTRDIAQYEGKADGRTGKLVVGAKNKGLFDLSDSAFYDGRDGFVVSADKKAAISHLRQSSTKHACLDKYFHFRRLHNSDPSASLGMRR